MRRRFAVIIPSKYRDILDPCIESIEKHEDPIPEIMIAWSGKSEDAPKNRDWVSVPDPWCFSKAINTAVANLKDEPDLVIVNDDVRLVMPTFLRIRQESYMDGKIGLVAPLVDGGVGNQYQSLHSIKRWPKKETGGTCHLVAVTGEIPICFVCVYLRRDAWNDVGTLDEGFVGYGRDDVDYSMRLRAKGWQTLLTRERYVLHGNGGEKMERGRNWSLSFARGGPVDPMFKENKEYFAKKWQGVNVSA
jgi:GT2 family glycosyltransferase